MVQPSHGQPPLRRDIATHTYKDAKAFNVHAPLMRNAGWQIMGHTERGRAATVTWYRDVPPTLPPTSLRPAPPRSGLHPLGIAGIVLGSLLLLFIVAVAATPTKQEAAATATSATTRLASGGSTPSVAPTVAAVGTATGIRSTPSVGAASPTATAMPPQVVTVKDNPVQVREAASADAPVIATLPVGTELAVLGPDATGPDGTTRWVPVAANGRNGFVRSDLVTARTAYAKATPIPAPVRTSTPSAQTTVVGAIDKCMYEGFGGGGDARYATSWYGNIRTYRLVGTRIDVETDLFFKDSNKQVATFMRSAVISCVFDTRSNATWVTVHAVNDSGVLAGGAIPGR